MSKKQGEAIKKARTEAGLTQEQLAKKITGISSTDISAAERGEIDLTQAVLKKIAKATGVTQVSLIDADKTTQKKSSASKKASASKKETKKNSLELTAAETNMVKLYRKADSETKKQVLRLLKGESSAVGDMLTGILGDAVTNLLGKK